MCSINNRGFLAGHRKNSKYGQCSTLHEHHVVTNQQQVDCLFYSLIRLTTKKTWALHCWYFVRGTSGHRWISFRNGQWCGNHFHVLISSLYYTFYCLPLSSLYKTTHRHWIHINVCRVSCGGVFNMLLVLSITFYFHYNIWGCMCSTGPFQYRWLKG